MPVQSTMSKNLFCKLLFTLLILFLSGIGSARANDLPLAAGSPTAGITFDDRPLMLPVQRNFQMAMLTASSELGRSCGHMEAYGWRMNSNEQQRVNQIFNNTVDRMRAQGFVVETKSPNSVSRDVTMFTADRPDKHLLFMWSAGEIGLVMVMCETSAPSGMSPQSSQTLKLPEKSGAPIPLRTPLEVKQVGTLSRTGKRVVDSFSPVGNWTGTYTCMQGTTGASLQITSLKGDHFEGTFRFYPTARNPNVPAGKYAVFGEYDHESNRILINPGKWIQHPKDYYNTIIIGSFDPVGKTFSGYFQGINGCTSIEAHYSSGASDKDILEVRKELKKASATTAKPKAKAKKKKTAKEPFKAQEDKKTPEVKLPEAKKEAPKDPIKASEPKGIDLGKAQEITPDTTIGTPPNAIALPPKPQPILQQTSTPNK